jgi:hypothetical protein
MAGTRMRGRYPQRMSKTKQEIRPGDLAALERISVTTFMEAMEKANQAGGLPAVLGVATQICEHVEQLSGGLHHLGKMAPADLRLLMAHNLATNFLPGVIKALNDKDWRPKK